MRWGAILVLAGGLGGCAVAAGEQVRGHYFGYVRVVSSTPLIEGGVQTKVETLGGWIEVDPRSQQPDSVGLGFRRAQRLVMPLDCRMAVIVSNEAHLAAARELVRELDGSGACAIDATRH